MIQSNPYKQAPTPFPLRREGSQVVWPNAADAGSQFAAAGIDSAMGAGGSGVDGFGPWGSYGGDSGALWEGAAGDWGNMGSPAFGDFMSLYPGAKFDHGMLEVPFGPDAAQPAYLTLDAAGHVGADFSGHLSALGIDLDAKVLPGSPAADNKIIWDDPTNPGAIPTPVEMYGAVDNTAITREFHVISGNASGRVQTWLEAFHNSPSFVNSRAWLEARDAVAEFNLSMQAGAKSESAMVFNSDFASDFLHNVQWRQASANLTLTTTRAGVPNCDLTTVGIGKWLVIAFPEFIVSAVGPAETIAELLVGGVLQTNFAIMHQNAVRVSAGHAWLTASVPAGTVIQLTGRKSVNSGVGQILSGTGILFIGPLN